MLRSQIACLYLAQRSDYLFIPILIFSAHVTSSKASGTSVWVGQPIILVVSTTLLKVWDLNRSKEACDMIFVHLTFFTTFVLVIFVIIFVPLLALK